MFGFVEMPSITYIYIIFIIASIAIFPYEIVSARFLDLLSYYFVLISIPGTNTIQPTAEL